jgi:hypothetical protein
MMLRSERADAIWKAHHADQADVTTTTIDPRAIAQAGDGMTLLAAALASDVGTFRQTNEDGSFSLLLYQVGHPDGSWAACDYEPGMKECEVTQYGDRRLWDEFAAVWIRWQDLGQPDADRLGLTVSRQGQECGSTNPSP